MSDQAATHYPAGHDGVGCTCAHRGTAPKGPVEQAHHAVGQRWWWTFPDGFTLAEGHTALAAIYDRVGDTRAGTAPGRHRPGTATTGTGLAVLALLSAPRSGPAGEECLPAE